jgi:hypothetical protein
MEIGKMKISEVIDDLRLICNLYGLKLNRVKDFNLARLILVNLYCQDSTYDFYDVVE